LAIDLEHQSAQLLLDQGSITTDVPLRQGLSPAHLFISGKGAGKSKAGEWQERWVALIPQHPQLYRSADVARAQAKMIIGIL
jgi:hypothetical protein